MFTFCQCLSHRNTDLFIFPQKTLLLEKIGLILQYLLNELFTFNLITMKKILFLVCALLVTIGTWADGTYTVNIVDGTQNPCGTLNNRTNSNKTLTSLDASGLAGVVTTAGAFDQATWWSKRCLAVKTSAAQTAEKVTITAPNGYLITGYSITFASVSGSYPYNYDLSDTYTGTAAAGTTLAEHSVSNLETSSTYFWIYCNASSVGNWLGISSFIVYLKDDPNAGLINVTYKLYESDGTTFVNSVATKQQPNSAIVVPASLTDQEFIYDYTPSGTIGDTDCTIVVTRTYKAGMVTSLAGLSNNKAYKLVTERGTFTTDNGALANTSKTGSSYTVYNFAIVKYEDAYYLWSVQDGKFVAGDDTKLTETPTAITLNALTEPLFKFQCGSQYLNCNTNAGGFFSTWSTTDGGNRVAIIEAADFDPTPVNASLTNLAPSVIENVKPFFDAAGTGLFQLKPTVASTYNATYTAALTNCSQATYEELEGVVTNVDNFNLPEDGKYYVIKNVSNSKYINVKSASGIYADVDAPIVGSITKAVIRNGHTYFATQEKEFGWCYTATYPALLDAAGSGKYAHFSINVPGQVAFAHCLGNGEGSTYATYLPSSYYTVGTNNQIVGGTATAAAAQWTFEEVTTFNLNLHEGSTGEYWATFYAPFGVVLPDGTKAYVGTVNDNTIELHDVGQNIPANTPVVLKGSSANITATIDDAVTNTLIGSYTNSLTGKNLAQDAQSDNLLSLGKRSDGTVGFYVYNGIIGANKAYIDISANPSNGFAFVFADDDVTAVNSVTVSAKDGQYYDLFGRKVATPAKGGLYIKNGKVVKM